MHVLFGLGFHVVMLTSYSWEISHENLHFYLLWKNWKICSIRLKILHMHTCKDDHSPWEQQADSSQTQPPPVTCAHVGTTPSQLLSEAANLARPQSVSAITLARKKGCAASW